MSLATGLVCKNCGQVFGVMRAAETPPQLEALCMPCAYEAAKEMGIELDTPQNWDAVFEREDRS